MTFVKLLGIIVVAIGAGIAMYGYRLLGFARASLLWTFTEVYVLTAIGAAVVLIGVGVITGFVTVG